MRVRGPKSGFRRTIPIRRKLRHNPTQAEQVFWSKVAKRGFLNLKFRKQHAAGPYIVDFYCPAKKLVVEIDGDTHSTDVGIKSEKIRTEYIESLGYKILRYQNSDVINNVEGIFEDFNSKLNKL